MNFSDLLNIGQKCAGCGFWQKPVVDPGQRKQSRVLLQSLGRTALEKGCAGACGWKGCWEDGGWWCWHLFLISAHRRCWGIPGVVLSCIISPKRTLNYSQGASNWCCNIQIYSKWLATLRNTDRPLKVTWSPPEPTAMTIKGAGMQQEDIVFLSVWLQILCAVYVPTCGFSN